MTTSTYSPTALLSADHEGARGTGGLAVAVDARLWPARAPLADARLRGDARSRDGGVREELAAGVAQLKPETEVEATSILPS